MTDPWRRLGRRALAAVRQPGRDKGSRIHIAELYVLCAVVLVPWIVYLAVTLPVRSVTQHYNLTWVGYDCLLVLAVLRTAWLGWHDRPTVVLPATGTGALLIADAWFDITTSTGSAIWQAAALAALVEIPTAVLSIALARRAVLRLASGRTAEP